MMYFKSSFTLLSLFALTGCSSYQEGFDCPAGVGVGCKSLSTVDQMIERGQLPKPIPEDEVNHEVIPSVTSPRAYSDLTVRQGVNAPSIIRIPEQSLRVWIKGYTDDRGHYHDHAVIYTVVQPASWQVESITQSGTRQTAPTPLPTSLLPTPLQAEVNDES